MPRIRFSPSAEEKLRALPSARRCAVETRIALAAEQQSQPSGVLALDLDALVLTYRMDAETFSIERLEDRL